MCSKIGALKNIAISWIKKRLQRWCFSVNIAKLLSNRTPSVAASAFSLQVINNTHRVKTVFNSIESKNGCLATSDFFRMFTQSIKFYTFHYYVLKSTDVWKMRFIKYTGKMNGCSFRQVLPQNLGWFLF